MTFLSPSRGMQGYAGGVIAGAFSAALFGFAFAEAETLFIMLAYLAAVPLFIAGLGAGVLSGTVASLVGVGGLCLIKQAGLAVYYGVAIALPAAVLTGLALQHNEADGKTEWYSEGNLMLAVVIYPCLAFVAAFASAAGHPGGLLGDTNVMLSQSIEPYKGQLNLDADTLKQLPVALDYMARILPGTLGCVWIIVVALSLIVAQATLKQQSWNLRPGFDLKLITLPRWFVLPMAAALVASFFAPLPYNYLGTNLGVMLGLAFFVAGLAIVHSWAAKKKGGTWFLVVFYVLLSIPLPWTVVPLTVITLLLGFTDPWIDFRRHIAGMKTGG
jgi:hypothetical protein